ncbi:D-allose ABC transporter permease [Gammaproteobacteria bacterium]|nr:D-allose ABC transporter permease [Gammaproteobacteria bacterium]
MKNTHKMNRFSTLSVWEISLIGLLILVLILGRILSEEYLSASNISNLLANFTEIALMALAMTLVICSEEIDLSVASILGLSSAIVGLLAPVLPMPMVICCALLAGMFAGAFNGLLIAYFKLPSLAVTIGTMALFRGITYILLGDRALANFPSEYTDFGINNIGNSFLPQTFIIVIGFSLIFVVLLQFSSLGRRIYAIGLNPTAAYFSGIKVVKIKFSLFMISGFMSALAGVIYTFRFSSTRGDNGMGFELPVIAAVLFGGVSIFGGKGSLYGVLLSLVLIGALNNALTLADVSNEVLTLMTGILLLSSILIPNLYQDLKLRFSKK